MLYMVDALTTKRILREPESGMGYQVLWVSRGRLEDDHDRKRYLVLNARYAIEIDPERLMIDTERHRDDFDRLAYFERTLEDEVMTSDNVNEKEVDTDHYEELCEKLAVRLEWRRLSVSDSNQNMEVEMHGSYPSHCLPTEIFVRYSAFSNDRRIRPNGSVMQGTYATTERDSRTVLSGLAAVGRYALPYPRPAIYCFRIAPSPRIPILVGTTSPAHSQAGGGVEVRFNQPTQTASVFGPWKIPER